MKRNVFALLICLIILALALLPAQAETCATAADMDAATRLALENTGRQIFAMVTRGDVAGLRQAATPVMASNFGSIESAVVENKANFAGAQPAVRSVYLLEAPGNAPLARAEFFCGVFNSSDRTAFLIPNLPPGRYGLVIMDATGGKSPSTLTLVLQDMQGQWKLGGFYPASAQIGGHDGQFYLTKAREYKAKGQNLAAWFYYLTAWHVLAPVDFMYTAQRDKLSDEMQAIRPNNLPSPQQPQPLTVGAGKTVNLIEMTPVPVGNDLYIRVKYQTPSVADTGATFQSNMAVIKAVVAQYPAFRDAFAGVVVRAVEASGNDYGSLLAMKDVK
jgi:hypothetical protein